jgi:hypothetical protein
MPSDRRDVMLDEILEVSKKTFSSIQSSYRTGRDGPGGPSKQN